MDKQISWPGWENVRLLGAGSFGKVYEIQRQESGETYKAALKIITIPQNRADVVSAYNDGMDGKSVTAYFHSYVEEITKEFALMSKLKGYTNIVSYEDHMVVEHENEIGWDILIRMELLTPLQEYGLTHQLTEEDVIKLGCDICRALELCEKKKIIHRDIKPENFFVNDNGDFKLGDFGIARTIERTMASLSKKGTYTYMAPEVYRGEKYGRTADIYSLATVLYRYLNENRTPFMPMGVIRAGDREEALNRRVSGEQVPAPKCGSAAIKSVIQKALAFKPAERYQSAAEFRQALQVCKVACNYASKEQERPEEREREETLYLWSGKESKNECETVLAKQKQAENIDHSQQSKVFEPLQKMNSAIRVVVIGLLAILVVGVGIWIANGGNHRNAGVEPAQSVSVDSESVETVVINDDSEEDPTQNNTNELSVEPEGQTPTANDLIWDYRSSNGLTWKLSDDGTLTIQGKGQMNSLETIGYIKSGNHKYLDAVQRLIIGDGVTCIAEFAFSDCGNLFEIQIPTSVTNIGDSAFSDCENLVNITIPSSVTDIGSYTFSGCSDLTEITIPESVTSIGKAAFYNCRSLTGISVPSGITSIENEIFYGCNSLSEIMIPSGVTSIGDGAFLECYSLTEVTIPSGVTNIGVAAFRDCSSLMKVTIPESVTSIEECAFYNDINLVLYVKSGSYAEAYAQTENITYEIVE